jgi:hypothetical protein
VLPLGFSSKLLSENICCLTSGALVLNRELLVVPKHLVEPRRLHAMGTTDVLHRGFARLDHLDGGRVVLEKHLFDFPA